jgi:ACS family allantoate permease-like MFS transporter
VEIVALLLNGWVGHITGQRILASLGGLVASIVGMLLIVALPLSNDVGRLIGYYLTQASPTPFVALLSLISSNVAGYTKKTTVAALYLIGYCAGNIIGEWISEKQYHTDTKCQNWSGLWIVDSGLWIALTSVLVYL